MLNSNLKKLQELTDHLTSFKTDFETFFETSQDLLSIFSTDGRYIAVNPTWETVMGYSLEEMRGRRWGTLRSYDRNNQSPKNPIMDMKDGDKMSNAAPVTTVTRNGSAVSVLWSAARVGDKIFSTGKILSTTSPRS